MRISGFFGSANESRQSVITRLFTQSGKIIANVEYHYRFVKTSSYIMRSVSVSRPVIILLLKPSPRRLYTTFRNQSARRCFWRVHRAPSSIQSHRKSPSHPLENGSNVDGLKRNDFSPLHLRASARNRELTIS